ncbi:DUF1499 domain-containing protein [Jeotgalibacillus soli]|uniref:DUF1499 domain-containing protein n=1 Tax=Jeotgalibacillus soli TaxID=889306 RepID=UPI001F25B378|nr:DUF1499 domain-containing protein [Jeotgalibacillus soli]
MDRTSNKKEKEHYIHVVFPTKLLRFRDDVEFLFDKNSTVIHFRSVSRVGYTDFNANRKRWNGYQKLMRR